MNYIDKIIHLELENVALRYNNKVLTKRINEKNLEIENLKKDNVFLRKELYYND